ncbi:MAG: hypothetical protein RIS29_934 [Bacteroidota bacterium]|jgi:hypothetical protein
MNTENLYKQHYCAPQLTEIPLDTEISLAMESSPPNTAPGESMLTHPQNSPYPTI